MKKQKTGKQKRFFIATAFLTVVSQVFADDTGQPIPIESFAQLPFMQSAELSPSGSHLAYIRPVNGRGHIIIQSLTPGNTPAVVPPAKNVDFDWVRWANDDRLVFSYSATSSRSGLETRETRLWAVNKDGSNAMSIVRPSKATSGGSNLASDLPPPQIQNNVIDWMYSEPSQILVALDGNRNGADEVRRIDVFTGAYAIARDDYDGIQHWMTDQSGELRLGWGYRQSGNLMLSKNANGRWSSAKKAVWYKNGFEILAFSADPDVAYMAGSGINGLDEVWKVNVHTGEQVERVFAKDGHDVNRIAYHPATGLPVGVAYTEHFPTVHYFDKTMAALQKAIDKAQPNTVNRMVSMSADNKKILIHSYSDTDPGTYNILDRNSRKLSFFAEAMPGLDPDKLSPVNEVSFPTRDDWSIPGYLTLPIGKEEKNLPLVVLPHGGPRARDDKSFWFLSQFIASRGYAVFQPNFRGSSGYGSHFENAGRKQWGGTMQDDVVDGTRWLVETGVADPKRICIVGWSYGGYSAAMGAVQTPELFQCAASINGVLNLPSLLANDRKYIGGSVWTRHIGLESESSKSVSPYHQADKIQIPMLIIQAKDDARVPENQGKRMAKKLKKLSKPVTYVEVTHGGHSMHNERARTSILESVESFLDANLKSPEQLSATSSDN